MALRPDPESLLKIAMSEEEKSNKGKLKIFLGYSAGVGKTYAMLETAKRLKKDGVDIVVGYVEPHKRAETQILLENQEIIPRKSISYRGTLLYEMDLDAVLKRHPAITIVDELAHTNAPGSRHIKRYQDVEEILAAGIDVYTTLNIQHLESLNNVITKVTGIAVQETVPDTLIDIADEIEVVDLPIGELLKRLKEGKVYLPEQAERAIENFFNEANLSSLRELTLRRAAKRVGARPFGKRSAAERLMVCVSSYASGADLVRSTKLLAMGLDAEWYAVYVETPSQKPLSEKEQDHLTQTLRLAEELGAKTATLSGRSVAEELVSYAANHDVSTILIGKPVKRKLKDVLSGSVVDQLIRLSGRIDVYAITSSPSVNEKIIQPASKSKNKWWLYGLGLLPVLFSTLISAVFKNYFVESNLIMFYLLAVVFSAAFLGREASILTSFLSVLAFDFFFVPPFFTFAVSDTQYLWTFFVFLCVGLVISTLTDYVKNQAVAARSREAYTASVYGLSRDLSTAVNIESITKSLAKHVKETLLADSAIFLRNSHTVEVTFSNLREDIADRELAVADWVAKNGQSAGWSTDTLPASDGYYIPLRTAHGIFGALSVYFKDKSIKLPLDRMRLLESFAAQSALAIERVQLSEEAHKSHILEEREKLQSALFNSISHDLRTPLVSITGSLSGMLDNPKMDEESRKELILNAYEEADRLNRLVGNLLDMARLEADALKIKPSPCEIRDVIGASLKILEDRLSDRKVTVNIEDNLPLVPMDFSLMMKVLVNLLDNAIKYAPFGLPIDIEAKKQNNNIEIKVFDRGLGIPETDLELIFDKFYRVNRPQNFEGTGLGLSICKGIVEAHQGKIRAESRQGGGTIVTVSLPIKI